MVGYFKALHIIFVVSWFAGLFYIVRLFIYHTEAFSKEEVEKRILHQQFIIMEKRLMHIITTPAMILTIVFGTLLVYQTPFWLSQSWMMWKLSAVVGLVVYHVKCILIMRGLREGKVSLSSTKLRMFNEIATVLLFAIVFLVVLKNALDMVWGVVGLIGLGVLFMILIKLYKKRRENKSKK